MHRSIKVLVCKSSNNKLLGSFDFNLNNILEEGKKDFSFKSQIGRINIQLMNAQIIKIPSFVEFIMGGMEICFVGAVDFTASNGNPGEKGTLHYTSHN
jgi:hypothetical protein